eukprot:5794554-Alexandrium_andersonii.AAC.1
MRPGEDAGPSRTAWPTQGRSASPTRTGCVAASSATQSPHRHLRTCHAEFNTRVPHRPWPGPPVSRGAGPARLGPRAMERSKQVPRGRGGHRDRYPPRPAILGAGPTIDDHLGQDPLRATGGRPTLEVPRAGFQVRHVAAF